MKCRDCAHWLCPRPDALAEYPRDRKPEEGRFDGVCPKLKRTLTITASGGWDVVDSVETDANFGCVLFQPKTTEQVPPSPSPAPLAEA